MTFGNPVRRARGKRKDRGRFSSRHCRYGLVAVGQDFTSVVISKMRKTTPTKSSVQHMLALSCLHREGELWVWRRGEEITNGTGAVGVYSVAQSRPLLGAKNESALEKFDCMISRGQPMKIFHLERWNRSPLPDRKPACWLQTDCDDNSLE